MTIKIYVRERIKVGSGVKHPKYRVLAISSSSEDDLNLEIEAVHFRKIELEQIAKDVGAKIVYLKPMPEDQHGKMRN